MRWLASLFFVLALGLMGCSEAPPALWDTCRSAEDCNQSNCHVIKCNAGRCEYDYNPSVACDDGNDCTMESCTPDWTCVHDEVNDVTCDFNGHAGYCVRGVCQEDQCEDIVCDDGNDCTTNHCISPDGSCVFHAVLICTPCDRNGVLGACVGRVCEEDHCEGVVCDDDNVCTNDSCHCETGRCSFREDLLRCSDGNPCTDDECDPHTGCHNPPALDGQPCGCSELRICGFPSCWPPVSQCVSFKHCQSGECV